MACFPYDFAQVKEPRHSETTFAKRRYTFIVARVLLMYLFLGVFCTRDANHFCVPLLGGFCRHPWRPLPSMLLLALPVKFSTHAFFLMPRQVL